MTIKLNRRTFIALLGATAAAATVARRPAVIQPMETAPDLGPLHFFMDAPLQPPVSPRTAAIQYLPDS